MKPDNQTDYWMDDFGGGCLARGGLPYLSIRVSRDYHEGFPQGALGPEKGRGSVLASKPRRFGCTGSPAPPSPRASRSIASTSSRSASTDLRTPSPTASSSGTRSAWTWRWRPSSSQRKRRRSTYLSCLRSARVCRGENVMRPYLQVVL